MTAVWDLVNPSDAITFVTDDVRIAEIVATNLGGGQYGATEVGGGRSVPIYLFGGQEARDDWWKENGGGMDPQAFTDSNRKVVREAFESVRLGSPSDRKLYDEALKGKDEDARKEFIAHWNDVKRSSMNDIASRARRIADAMAKADAIVTEITKEKREDVLDNA